MAQEKPYPEFEAAMETVTRPFLRPMLDALIKSLDNAESKILNAPQTYRRKLMSDLENAKKKITITADPEEYGRSAQVLLREALWHPPRYVAVVRTKGISGISVSFLDTP